MKILLVIPSVFEAAPLFKAVRAKPTLGGVLDISENLRVLISGIGCEASRERLDGQLRDFAPNAVVLLGYAGACSGAFKNGDFLFDSDDPRVSELLGGFGFPKAKIAFSKNVAGAEQKRGFLDAGFAAVEMESDWFLSAVRAANASFTHVRCISDAANASVPPAILEASMDRRTGGVAPARMIFSRAFLKNPPAIFSLVKFGIEIVPVQKKYAKSIVELADALAELAGNDAR